MLDDKVLKAEYHEEEEVVILKLITTECLDLHSQYMIRYSKYFTLFELFLDILNFHFYCLQMTMKKIRWDKYLKNLIDAF